MGPDLKVTSMAAGSVAPFHWKMFRHLELKGGGGGGVIERLSTSYTMNHT